MLYLARILHICIHRLLPERGSLHVGGRLMFCGGGKVWRVRRMRLGGICSFATSRVGDGRKEGESWGELPLVDRVVNVNALAATGTKLLVVSCSTQCFKAMLGWLVAPSTVVSRLRLRQVRGHGNARARYGLAPRPFLP